MTDIVDRAQPYEEALLVDAHAMHVARMFHEEPRIVNGKRLCLDCNEPLSKKRIEAESKAVRCVDCQNLHEQLQRRQR